MNQIGIKKLDNGIFSTLIIRTAGIPFGVQNYLGGLIGMNIMSYMLGSFIGILPWIIGLTLLGESLIKIDQKILIVAILLLLSFYSSAYLLTKKIRHKFISGREV